MIDPVPPSSGPKELTEFLTHILETSGPRLILVQGAPGAGKSSLLHDLATRLSTPWVFTLYTQPMIDAPEAGSGPRIGGPSTLLWMNPRRRATPAPSGPSSQSPDALAGHGGASAEFMEEVRRLEATPSATVLVDSWDHDSERFVRSLSPDPSALVTTEVGATGFAALQSTLLGLKLNTVLAMLPQLAAPLQSLAETVVELKDEAGDGARWRVISVAKLRGAPQGPRDQLYTLESGTFRCFPDLPKGFVPAPAAPDADPAASTPTLWPGSEAFARAFGRLRFGGYTALSISAGVAETFATAVAQPIAAHVVRSGGRVVWMPPPSVRPVKVVAMLREMVPPEWLRERFRVLSASGTETALGDLSEIVLPLRREMSTGGDVRAATSPGVGPIFPEAHHFLRRSPDGCPALYILSIEGLKACASLIGLSLNLSTMPAVLASYTNLPRFHGFGYGQLDDPLTAALLPIVDSHIDLRVLHGRAVVTGQRPRSLTFVLDWPGSSGRYDLVPVT